MKLERQSPAAAHWSEQEYRRLVESAERLLLIAEDGPSTATDVISPVALGFLVAHHIPPDWELENIVVAATSQRRGIASRLLGALFAKAREAKSDSIFLEVRESNTPARALYLKAGFRLQARRKSYYTGPIEDAILYSLKLR
jgi:ribosomal-protein-alanine N-acetyltransferase